MYHIKKYGDFFGHLDRDMVSLSMDIHAFALKYGIRGMGLVIERVLELVPEAAQNEKNYKLGQLLGEMVADLETSLTKVLHK